MATRPATSPKGPGSRLRKAGDKRGEKGGPNNPRRLSPDELKVLTNMCMAQMTTRDQAAVLGISETTLERMASDDPLVSDAIARGRSEGMRIAHTWAFKKAFTGQGNVDMAKFWLRFKGGWKPEPTELNLGASPGGAPAVVEFVLKGGATLPDALERFIDKPQAGASLLDPADENDAEEA